MVFSATHDLNVKTLLAKTDDESVRFYEHTYFIAKHFVKHFGDGDIVRYKCYLKIIMNDIRKR